MTTADKQRYREEALKRIAQGLVKRPPPGTYHHGNQSVPRHLPHMPRLPARRGPGPNQGVVGIPPSRV